MNNQYTDSITKSYLDNVVASAQSVRLKLAEENRTLKPELLDILRNVNNKITFLEMEICKK